MPHFDRCVIATRESPLAMWQALHVQALLRDRYPGAEVELLGMTTRGDQILDRTLSKVGGKGLFVKELEAAMLEGRADLAVHSLKDVPMELPEGFELVAVSEREDPRDAFVSPKYASLDDMPAGARVGTASLRRELMLRMRYPHLEVLPVRGNVGTRLRKLDEGQFDALVMASAGLKAARVRGKKGGRPSKGKLSIDLALKMYDSKEYSIRQILDASKLSKTAFRLRDKVRSALRSARATRRWKPRSASSIRLKPVPAAWLNVLYRAHWAVPVRCRSRRMLWWKRASSGCARSSATIRKARPRSLKPAVLWPSPKRSPLVLLKTCAVKVQKII